MARRSFNDVRTLGVVLLLLGLLLEFVNGKSFLWGKALEPNEYNGHEVIVLNREEGMATLLITNDRREPINHNAADDPAFKGISKEEPKGSLSEFLGLYDADLGIALKIILFALGGILIIVSSIKTKR